jgi:maltose alpha-D-glucosyltransferase/alpha-amylase
VVPQLGAKDSDKRNFYVWSDGPAYAGTRIIFTDTEKSDWTWDDLARQPYWHRFFGIAAGPQFDNPKVTEGDLRTNFWLDMGVDGFRLDAIPYLRAAQGTNNENLPETHAVISDPRADRRHYGNRLLLAEANQWPEDVRGISATPTSAHGVPLPARPRAARSAEDRYPITEIMAQTRRFGDLPVGDLPAQPRADLGDGDQQERDYMRQTYTADRARLNLGIRRRSRPCSRTAWTNQATACCCRCQARR